MKKVCALSLAAMLILAVLSSFAEPMGDISAGIVPDSFPEPDVHAKPMHDRYGHGGRHGHGD